MTPEGTAEACPDRAALEEAARGGVTSADLDAHLATCSRCSTIVTDIRNDNDLLAEFLSANADRLDADQPIAVGVAPPGYRIESEIHRGTQGVVYQAEQLATKRTVALKMILQGAFATDRQRHRFEREVELVAALRHPNIVTVFDSGQTADGRHYLAMEHVEGVPLDTYVRRMTPDGDRPPVDRVLDLMSRIGAAVDAAHRRGIIHRDLKPANILVDEAGEPRVLDFGLAKVTGPEAMADAPGATMAGEFLGTFAYAAPEQVAADPNLIDTRTDVYAMGVILYELLIGERPYDLSGSIGQVVDTIVHAEPEAPTRRRPELDEDIDTIIMTALAKDQSRRYASMHALIDDIRHHQRGEPIDARRDDRWYVLRRTVRRYRVPIFAVTTLFIILTTFAAVTTWLYIAKDLEAQRRLRTLEGFASVISATDLENPDEPLPASTIRELLDQATRIVDDDLADMPAVAATIRTRIGLAHLSHSQWEEANRQLTTALTERRASYSGEHPAIAESLHNLGRLHWKRGRYPEARRFYEEALETRESLYEGDHIDIASSLHHLGSTLRLAGALQESEQRFVEAVRMRKRLHGDDSPAAANSLNGLGNCLHDMGRHREALDCYRQSHRAVEGEGTWREARAMHRRGLCLLALGDIEQASMLLERAESIKLEVRPDDRMDLAVSRHGLALLDLHHRRLDEARARCEWVRDIRMSGYNETHPEQAESLDLLGQVLLELGDLDGAEAVLHEALDMRRRLLPDDHWATAITERRLGACHLERGQIADAITRLEHAHDILTRVLAPEAPELRRTAELLDRAREAL